MKEGFNLALPKVTEPREIQEAMFHADSRNPNTRNMAFRKGKTDL